jgi:hypothetical protein
MLRRKKSRLAHERNPVYCQDMIDGVRLQVFIQLEFFKNLKK